MRTGRSGSARASPTPRRCTASSPAAAGARRGRRARSARRRSATAARSAAISAPSSPAGDALPPLTVEGAEIECTSARGSRRAARARVHHRGEAERARAGRADHRRLGDAVRRAADLHEGRAAERDGDRRRLALPVSAGDELRASFGSASARPVLVTAPRARPSRSPSRSPPPPRRSTTCAARARYRTARAARARRARARPGARMRISVRVNGEVHEADCWEGESLLFVLREKLGFPGAKNACEQGECGSCSVLLDGTLVCACLVLGAQAHDREVTTVEGLADGERLHRVQEAFVEAGAVQCGFCTPGLIVATVDLLRAHAAAVGRRDPRGALGQPLPLHRLRQDLRCGAARRERMTQTAPRPLQLGQIGESVRRPDGVPKVTGEFAYSSDLIVPGMLWGHTLRSPHAHARIRSDRHLRGRCAAGRPCRAHPRRCSGREVLRPRVRRSARARDRPRPLLRRARRAGRRRASRAGAPRRREDPHRLRAAPAGDRHGARDRARRPPPRAADAAATATARTTGRTSSATS